MSATRVLALVHFYLQFIARRVLGRGLLRHRGVRLALGAGVILCFVGFALLSVVVIQQMFADSTYLPAVVEAAGISAVFWVVAVYAVVRVLFLKADELTALTFTLPVTNQERTVALLAFEGLLVGAAATAGLGGFCTAALIVLGPSAVPGIVFGVVAPVTVTYLLLSALHVSFERLCLAVGLSRWRGILQPVLFGTLMVGSFLWVNAQTLDHISAQFGQATVPWVPQLFLLQLATDHGWLAGLAAWAVALGAGVMLILGLAPAQYQPITKFMNLPLPGSVGLWGATVRALLRSFENQFILVCALVISIPLALSEWDLPPAHVLLPAFMGLYAYAVTEPLRRLPALHLTPWRAYVLLMGGQGLIVGSAALVLGGLHATVHGDWFAVALMAGMAAVSLIMSTLIGIAFPPERGNPFSVAVGITLLITVGMTVLMGVNLFNFPLTVNLGLLTAVTLIAVFYSVLGIHRNQQRNRHELDHQDHHRPDHRADSHQRRSRRLLHRRHVLHATGSGAA
ncbi:MAG: hypothetical protein Q4G34_06935 [Micrococcus sp.]|nr:hypothetical protein [Micrococcus sp.]